MKLFRIDSGVGANGMEKPILFRCFAFFFVGLCTLVLGWFQGNVLEVGEQSAIEHEGRERTVRYSFVLNNDTNQAIRDVTFSAFAPVKETPFQSFQSINATSPFELKSDGRGNQWLEFSLSEIGPYADKIITVTATVVMRSSSSSELPAFLDVIPDLRRKPALDPRHPKVQEALNSIGPVSDQSSVLSWLGQATMWVHSSIDDVGYVSRDLGAHYAIAERKGDCTEFMHALVELTRLNGLPAVAVAGFRASARSQLLDASDYHNWAMVSSGTEWFVSDPHANVFGSRQDEYIVFNLLDSSREQINSQRFFSHDSRITAAMR